MKKQKFWQYAALILMVSALVFTACNKDDETTFDLSSIMAGSSNLNGATPPTNVPVDANIVVTYNLDVDASSVSNTSVKLTRIYDNTLVDIVVSVSGMKVTIDPVDDLGSGTQFTLKMPQVKADDGQTMSGFERSFTTLGTFAPTGVVSHWTFEGNANDVVGTNNASAAIDVAYQASRNATAGTAAFFNGTSSIIEMTDVESLMNTHDFTLSFWFKTKSEGHVDGSGNPKGHFVMGMGAFKGFQFEVSGDYGSCKLAAQYEFTDGTTGSEDLWFNGDGKTGQNGGWQGWTFCKDLTGSGGVTGIIKDNWTHVACVYNSTTKVGTLYLNGEKMKAQDFNLWPAGDPKQGVLGLKWGGIPPEVYPDLAFGFIQSRRGDLWDNEPWGGYEFASANHFGGWLDDIRIFHVPLTEQEVDLMYQSEKP